MRTKHKATLIGLTSVFAIASFFTYNSLKEITAFLSFTAGIIGSLIPLFIELLKETEHPKTIKKNTEKNIENEELLISSLNNTINNLKENKIKQARASIQEFRLTLIKTRKTFHTNSSTFKFLLKTSAELEKETTQGHEKIRRNKNNFLEKLFNIKEAIETSITTRDPRTRSPITIASTAICFFISIATLFFSYFSFIAKSDIGLIISLFLFSFFTTCLIGLLFNKRWAKISLKITFIAGTILIPIAMIYIYTINIPDDSIFLRT